MGKLRLRFVVQLAREEGRALHYGEDNAGSSGDRGRRVTDSFRLGSFGHILSFLASSGSFLTCCGRFL